MIISESIEAYDNSVSHTNDDIFKSNQLFAKTISESIDNDDFVNVVKSKYNSETNNVIKFNMQINLNIMFKKIFCSHDYEIINQFTIKSAFDIIADRRLTPNTHSCMKRQYITDFKCSKCNKLKRCIEVTKTN